MSEQECCEFCNDGDGHCIYPYYGVAPHIHKEGPMIGSTVVKPKSAWPSNFREDPDVAGLGTFTHCLECGRGEQQEDNPQ